MKKTIYINGRFLTQPSTGVQRYAREIIRNFDLLLKDDRLARDISIRCLVPPGAHNETPWRNIPSETVGVNRGNLWEQIDLPLILKKEFLFSPANTGPFLYRNQAITFHDASIFAVPHAYSFPFRAKHILIFKSLSRTARAILTDSHFSQTELAQYLNQPLERFKVVFLAGDHIQRIQADERILGKYDLVKNGFLLTVASQSPHKNLTAVRNTVKLIDSKIKVVLAGGQFQKVFSKEKVSGTTENLIALGYVTDEELRALYQNALGYIFPSYYEGFGLPILEAMHCGCPVLCSQTGALPEVAGDAALFFDPMNSTHIAESIKKILKNPLQRNAMIQKGYQRAEEFNWRTTAKDTLEILCEVAGVNV